MVSSMKYHVSNGNARYEAENARNLDVHRAPVASTMSLDPNRKQSPVGRAYSATVKTGCFCHHSHTNCEFSWNHAKTCPNTNNPKPAMTLEVGNYKLFA